MAPGNVEQALGYSFHDPTLLREALTHASATVETGTPSNQRLEYLGDAVLELLVSERLFADNPAADEGVLTVRRSALVNGENLARIARRINLGTHIILSEAARQYGSADSDAVLGDALEAVVGAVYLDGGIEAGRAVCDHLFEHLDFTAGDPETAPEGNPKGTLQEMLHSHAELPHPEYEIVEESGPPHDRIFTAVVRCAGRERGRGTGKSKKAAESGAAEEFIRHLRKKLPS